MNKTQVILVDEYDREVGKMEKLQAHREARLHRAFSVLIFNASGELLLQRRADGKYHSAGLWSNTCCSHAVPGEELVETIHQRLQFEMGFDCPLHFLFHFMYRIELDNDLVEYEYDHVFAGIHQGQDMVPHPAEVSACQWMPMDRLLLELRGAPASYTPWLYLICRQLLQNREAMHSLKDVLAPEFL
jgi:isopentenyl-diphosphate delta-isomerase